MPALIVLAYASMLFIGMIDNIRGPFFLDISNEMHVNGTVGSLFFATMSAFCFIGSSCGHRLLRNRSAIYLMTLASFALTISFSLVGAAPNYFLLILAIVPFGFFYGALNFSQNALVVEAAKPLARRRLLSGLHSMYGLASLLAPLAASLFRWCGLGWRGSFIIIATLPALSVLPVLNRVVRTKWPNRAEPHVPLTASEWSRLAFFGILLAGYLYGEISVGTRLVFWLRADRGFTPDRANLYMALFYFGLLFGRVAFSFIQFSNFSNERVLILSSFLAGVLYWFGLQLDPMYLVLSGLAMAPFYPIAMDEITVQFGAKGGAALGHALGISSIGVVTMHLGLGWLRDQIGMTAALGVCASALLGVSFLLLARRFLFMNARRFA